MRFLLKTVLAWLLVVAIPVQGFAATALLLCAPNHHGAAMAVSTMANPEASHHHAMDSDAPAQQAASLADDFKSSGFADSGKCGACAACCTGSAVASLAVAVPLVAPVRGLIPFQPLAFASHIPAAFDPPPRAFLA